MRKIEKYNDLNEILKQSAVLILILFSLLLKTKIGKTILL
ncbi:hypothetical protein J2S17_004682 [Cytobacillus purgationiresistens]|uniref:Uncharacterized protein n=1 Tax=Cytobacillus purgationiresistens TaxID=863449 RepID=A0ABU0ANC9_9BACI|nr:hypothetical protein [Cytobacillus purgationiresistens]